MTSPLLVIEHHPGYPPGLLGAVARERGVDLSVIQAHAGELVPEALDEAVGLVVLDGPMGAYETTRFPFLSRVQSLLMTATVSGVPTLAIGLGHQLMAVTLGGRVTVAPHGPSQGLTAVRLTAPGRTDELIGRVGPGARGVVWHHDVVAELPRGAEVLATGDDDEVLAVRFAPRCWGVQFHPEATAQMFTAWASAAGSPSEPTVMRRGRSSVQAATEAVVEASDALALRWVAWLGHFIDLAVDGADNTSLSAPRG